MAEISTRRAAMPKKAPSKKKLEAAMREVHTNEPSTVARADVSEPRKEKMRQAIAYSKARKGSKSSY
jgi:hypothetical protein